ncbi:NAD(P)-dependent oxidoreductase [Facklamia sp. 7083-14-GEN3]|uniref:NAD(P)-dependent oxidoreductase n=1 Tax=Facklamia sp. 7083-14-GEN3 TaxID=2973478 RepID=UPI00215D267F|nr:NAD(P)-dependent oxidoreductase [Facklamia sp. 7083-14-GEN3]MCR8969041.1 NAD(P)-binding domain-containing protein [Facklamia sp. 7083-14-GEN3]
MKIVVLENLKVPQERIEEMAKPLVEAGHEFKYYPEKTTDSDEMVKRCQGADIITLANNPLPEEVLDQLDQLKYINVAFTGVDHIPLIKAKDRDILVSNAAGYANTAVAELVIGMTLNLLRQLRASDQEVRLTEDFPGIRQGSEIKGKTVGIIGTGKIGKETAKLFKAFGANLMGFNRSRDQELIDMGMDYSSLEELLAQSDIITIHLPLNRETQQFFGENQLKAMKESAILINCARGPIVDAKALAEALAEGEIAGAGIDVFDSEAPLREDHPLLSAPNTLLSPHIGYFTHEAMDIRAQIAFENIYQYLKDQPQNLV